MVLLVNQTACDLRYALGSELINSAFVPLLREVFVATVKWPLDVKHECAMALPVPLVFPVTQPIKDSCPVSLTGIPARQPA